MKYLLLLLIPAISFGQQKKKTNPPSHYIKSAIANWVHCIDYGTYEPESKEFYIEYGELQSILSYNVPYYKTTRCFYASIKKDTLFIRPSLLDSLIKDAHYIKVAGRLYKLKEDKQ